MNHDVENIPTGSSVELQKGIRARAIQILLMFIIMGLELFVGSGQLGWIWAWIFLGIGLVSVAINAVFMLRNSPGTVAERGRPKEVKGWDKLIGGGLMVGQYFLVPLISALDLRLHWTGGLAIRWHWIGALGYTLGMGLTSWAMVTNAFFSTAVRIQSDRGQEVCHSGPYRFVRHPGYVGYFIQALSTPLLLGSVWALWFAIPAAMLIIVRTSLEDKMLQEQLPGYEDYSRQVRFRLLPGVW